MSSATGGGGSSRAAGGSGGRGGGASSRAGGAGTARGGSGSSRTGGARSTLTGAAAGGRGALGTDLETDDEMEHPEEGSPISGWERMGGAGDEHIGEGQAPGGGDWDEEWSESDAGGTAGTDPFEEEPGRSDQEDE